MWNRLKDRRNLQDILEKFDLLSFKQTPGDLESTVIASTFRLKNLFSKTTMFSEVCKLKQ